MAIDKKQEKQDSSFVARPLVDDFKPLRPQNKFRSGKFFLRETILSQMASIGKDRESRNVRAYIWRE